MVAAKKNTGKERAHVRAIPGTPESWRKEVDGIIRFATAKPKLIDAHGAKWFKNIFVYYIERLTLLCTKPPKGVTKAEARAILADVKRKIA